MNGKFAASEIWVNTLTPEDIAASEREYQARRREKRRRIDVRFAPRTDAERRSQKYSAPPKPKLSALAFSQRCDRLIDAMERLAARDRRNRMLSVLEF